MSPSYRGPLATERRTPGCGRLAEQPLPPLPAALARPPLVWAPVLTEQAPCGRKLGVRLAPCGAWSDPELSAWVREAEGAARRQVRPLPAAPPRMARSGLPLSCPARLVPPSVLPLEHGPLEHFQGQLAWLVLALAPDRLR